MKIPFASLVGGAANGSGTRYYAFAGQGAYTATVSTARTPMPVGGVISNLYVKIAPQLTAGSYVFTLMVNGSATALTCTISSGASTASDTSNTVNVSAGDLCEWRVVGSGADTLTQMATTAVFESNVARVAPLFAGHSTGTDAYFMPPSGISLITTEGFGTGTMAVAGDISYMRVKLTTAPGAGVTRTYTLRKNGADQGLSVAISDSATEGTSSATVSFSPGDDITIGLVNTGGTPATSHAGIGLTWNPTVNGYFPLISVANSAFATTGTRYIPVMGITPGGTTTESNIYEIAPYDMVIDNMYAEISNAPTGATKSRTFTLRTGGTTDTALTTTIPDTQIHNEDTNPAHAQSITANTLIAISEVPANTPAAITAYNRVGMRGYITPTDATGRVNLLMMGVG